MRTLVLVVLTAACGGKTASDTSLDEPSSSRPAGSETGGPWIPASPASPPYGAEEDPSSVTEDGEWGTWQLLSVDGRDGERRYDPPYVELDLHPDGRAYLWTCALAPTGDGARCPYWARMQCRGGTMKASAGAWRVEFPPTDREGAAARGVISREPSGDITVKGEGALHPSAHYRRVAAPSIDGCAP